jgi:hypothetical protein
MVLPVFKWTEEFATTWVKSGGRWKLGKEISAGPPKMMVDGKPV